MKDCKFKSLILDVYADWKTRTFVKEEYAGIKATYNNYFGLIYDAISTDSFDNVKDIHKYMDIVNPDMLLLHSRVTNEEIEVYSWDLKDYTIKDDILIITFNNNRIKEFEL